MSKNMLIFLKIIYYAFTFVIGIVVALTLPNIYMYEMSVDTISRSLSNADYENAMVLMGGYFNSSFKEEKNIGDAKIVIFESATLFSEEDKSKLQKAYSGFIFNLDGYNYKGNDSKATLEIFDGSNDINIDILDYDENDDDINDSIASLNESTFIYFTIPIEKTTNIKKIKLLDSAGVEFGYADFDLDFSEVFFSDVDDFIQEYNLNFESSMLESLDKEFRSKNENYKMSSYGDVKERALTKATLMVLVYFIVIYIIADFLVGKHYILKLIKKIIKKVKKEEVKENEDFYGDYYCSLTFKVIEIDPNITPSIIINYQNEKDKIEFFLNKDNSYQMTKRVHAGLYLNAWCESNDCDVLNVPKELKVNGYFKTVEIKLKKKDNI